MKKYNVYGIGNEDILIAEGVGLIEAERIADENAGNYPLGTNIVDEDGNDAHSPWYAVMLDREDTDWGYGSHDLDEARM